MEIIDGRALKLRTKKYQEIAAVVPKSMVTQVNDGVGEVVVHWGLEEAQVLRNMKIRNVPSPIIRGYKWPGKFSPYTHQKQTAAFATLNRRCFILNDLGTGKSAAAAWASDYLLKKGFINRVLIVCPLSVIKTAWLADLFSVLPHRTVGVAYGVKKERKKVIDSDAEYVIINYDGLEVVQDEIKAGGFDLIIADEASALKNVNTRRWKTFASLVEPNTWLWLMTGTPAAQSPVDAYGLAKLVNPAGVSRSFTRFKDLVMLRTSQFRWIPRHNATNIVHEVLQPAIRFTKAMCLDLPEMTYTMREVPLNSYQQKYYTMIKQEMTVAVANETVTAQNAAGLLNKLMQVSAGAVYSDSRETVEFDVSNRYKVLLECVEATQNKILVFVNYTHTIRQLEEKLLADGYSVGVINGSVSLNKRTELINAFQQQADPRILLIQPQAAAHGITLHAADTVVWWGPITSTETYLQANARAHRAGQRNPVTVIHLQGSPVERKIYRLLRENLDVHGRTLELYNEEMKSLDMPV